MAFQFFCVRILDPESEMKRMNEFLRTHNVLSRRIDQFTKDGECYYAFLLEYADSSSGKAGGTAPDASRLKPKPLPRALMGTEIKAKDALVAWRTSRAKATNVPSYEFGNNSEFEWLVFALPKTVDEALGVREVSRQRIKLYSKDYVQLLAPFCAAIEQERKKRGEKPYVFGLPSKAKGKGAGKEESNASEAEEDEIPYGPPDESSGESEGGSEYGGTY